MVKHQYWISITIGIFLADVGIGYSMIQSNDSVSIMMTPQQMQQAMI